MTDEAAYGRRDTGDIGDVDDVTAAVLTASRLLVAITARSLAAVEETVTLPQLRMLVVLSTQGSCKLVELAQALGVNPSTAMRMVDRLSASGLISRRTSPRSARELQIDLTDGGRALVDGVTERRRAEIAAVITKMPPDRRRELVTALRAFTDAGGEPPVDSP